jgi:hypothetical protein
MLTKKGKKIMESKKNPILSAAGKKGQMKKKLIRTMKGRK